MSDLTKTVLSCSHGTVLALLTGMKEACKVAGNYAQDEKLSEFIEHRLSKCETALQKYPITLDDIREARSPLLSTKDLIIELRDTVQERFVQQVVANEDKITMEDRQGCAMGATACALFNAAIETINSCGLMMSADRLQSLGGGKVGYKPEKDGDCPDCGCSHKGECEGGGAEKPDVEFKAVNLDDLVAGRESLPPEVIKALSEAMEKLAGKKPRRKKKDEE